MVYLIFIGKCLQLAVSACFAEKAEVIVFCKYKFQYLAPIFLQLFRVCSHYKSIACWISTGRVDAPFTLYVYHAETTRTDGRQSLPVTQGGNINVIGATNIKNRIPFFTFYLIVVYGKRDLSLIVH
jgi:hypothetical protein